jgi:hypothetical protein
MKKEMRDVVLGILKQRVLDNERNRVHLMGKQMRGKLSENGEKFMDNLETENTLILEAVKYIYKGENNGKRIHKVK